MSGSFHEIQCIPAIDWGSLKCQQPSPMKLGEEEDEEEEEEEDQEEEEGEAPTMEVALQR